MSFRDEMREAFLLECARQGLTADEIGDFAAEIKSAGAIGDVAGSLMSLLGLAGTAAVVGPPAMGYLGGRLSADLAEAESYDPEDVRTQELIDEYRRQRQQQLKQRRTLQL